MNEWDGMVTGSVVTNLDTSLDVTIKQMYDNMTSHFIFGTGFPIPQNEEIGPNIDMVLEHSTVQNTPSKTSSLQSLLCIVGKMV